MIEHVNPDLANVIGNTPMAKIFFTYKGEERIVYAKLESFNMTGSVKDRIAYHIISKAHKNGALKPGDEIVEATSGNTGISFSGIGVAFNHPVTIYMPNWMSEERIRLIKSFGATIRLVTPEEGGFLGSIEMAEKHKKDKENVFLPRQFDNSLNVEAHYLSTGPEIEIQLKKMGLKIDAFVAGVGTGGTVMGTGKYLKEKYSEVKVHPLEPSNSPTLSTGYKVGKHRIQGVSDEFIPSIVKLDQLDSIIEVDDGDAIIMSQLITKKLGIGVGISSGANFIGALIAQNKIHSKANVVTIFSDSNKKYLSTDLSNEEPVKDDFYSTNIKLNGFELVSTCVSEGCKTWKKEKFIS
jgi:cysteine synthase A